MIFGTERLLVREWTDADLDVLADIYSRPEVTRWLGRGTAAGETPAERLVRWRTRGGPDSTYGVWAITLRSDGTPVGTVLLVPLPGGEEEIEVGWHLHPDRTGSGYATEAAAGALARGFENGLTEIFAVLTPDNVASAAVARRLGMVHIGRTDRYYDGEELELFRIAGSHGSDAALHAQRDEQVVDVRGV